MDGCGYSAQIKSIPSDSFKYARTTVVNEKSIDILTVKITKYKKTNSIIYIV